MSRYQKKQFEAKVTNKGTELPLLDLKGKPYLQVAHRIVWFREENPDGVIFTEMVNLSENKAVVKATIQQIRNNAYITLATAHKSETEDGFPDFVEKAETGAIGRALALCGYGTQFEPALDEEDRLADAPVEPVKKAKVLKTKNAKSEDKKIPERSLKEVLELATSISKVVIKQEKATKQDIVAYMEKEFGVNNKENLSLEQANKLVTYLEGVVNA